MKRLLAIAGALVFGALVMLSPGAWAGDPAWAPKPARGAGDACVAETDWMRRNHMRALDHQRDDTVHEGVRTERFSLKGCIACHAVKGQDGHPVTVADSKHFCRTCHDYAAVKVDCFECHASRPAAKSTAGDSAEARGLLAALADYLKGAVK